MSQIIEKYILRLDISMKQAVFMEIVEIAGRVK